MQHRFLFVYPGNSRYRGMYIVEPANHFSVNFRIKINLGKATL